MRALLVSKLAQSSRAITTIVKYAETARAMGHEVAIFGEKDGSFPGLESSLDVKAFDVAIFVVYMPFDFPDLPYLAMLLDGMPKERRIVIDCLGRYNDTVRVEHDFNHLEKMEGHQGWEWIEAFQAVAGRVLQPTLTPLRDDVMPFLFHGYDAAAVARSYRSASEAARAWKADDGRGKTYGIAYVGNNWQRWTQVRAFLEGLDPIRKQLGRICLVGWDWGKRPDWAVQLGIRGADVDPELLARLSVETRDAIPFTAVRDFLGQASFTPLFHRPLFNELGLVTNRTFETFTADTLPLLFLPKTLAETIYGPGVAPLLVGDNVADHVQDVVRHPERYWEAVLEVRRHLGQHHSFRQRLTELVTVLAK
jgi:hypothetical protein